MATIIVTGRDSQVTSRNKEHAEEKIGKLAKYFGGIVKIEAVLGHSGDGAEAEVVISVPRGSPIVCRSAAKDLYCAIDLVLDKAETQLTKYKERMKARKVHRGMPEAPYGVEAALESEGSDDQALESYDDVIDKREF